MELISVNLNWSIRPLVTWLRWTTGVDALALDSNLKISFYQLICLSVHSIFQVFIIYHLIHDPKSVIVSLDPSHVKTTTKIWNAAIDYMNWIVVALVSHVTLLAIVRTRFPILVSYFRRSTHLLDRSFYIKLRRLSILGVGGIVLLVSLFIFDSNCLFCAAIMY